MARDKAARGSEVTLVDPSNTSVRSESNLKQGQSNCSHSLSEEEEKDVSSCLVSACTEYGHAPPCLPRRRFDLWQQFGLAAFLTVTLGNIVILTSCTLLLYLWRGTKSARDRQEPEFWRTIVSNDWTARVVTICAAAIRTSMGIQFGLVTAALSATILETSGAHLNDIPALSLERASKSGFFNVLPVVIRQTTTGRSGRVYSFIIVVGVTITIFSPFISTILLSDFTTTHIPAPSITKARAITSSKPAEYNDIYNFASYWRSKPAAKWRFAEDRRNGSKDDDEFPVQRLWSGDTGDTYRAMLPLFDAASRTSLQSYAGPALVFNTRTICFSPSFENASIEFGKKTLGNIRSRPNSTKPATLAELRWGKDKRCQLHYKADDTDWDEWPTSLCLDQKPEVMDSKILNGLKKNQQTGELYNFRPVLMLKSTDHIASDAKSKSTSSTPERLRKLNFDIKLDNVWAAAYDSEGNMVVNATVCLFNQYSPQLYRVVVSGKPIPLEAIADPEKNKVNSDESFEGDVLDLEFDPPLNFTTRHSFPKHQKQTLESNTDANFLTIFNELPLGSSSAWSMAPNNVDDLSWAAHPAHTSPFHFTVGDDPAAAVQDLVTQLYQMTYYDHLDKNDLEFPVKTVNLADTLIPTKWTGFIIVFVLIGCHMMMFWTIMFLFALNSEYSALGNGWFTLTQTARMAEAIESSEMMLDHEVEHWAKMTGKDKQIYGLPWSSDDRKIEVSRLKRKTGDQGEEHRHGFDTKEPFTTVGYL